MRPTALDNTLLEGQMLIDVGGVKTESPIITETIDYVTGQEVRQSFQLEGEDVPAVFLEFYDNNGVPQAISDEIAIHDVISEPNRWEIITTDLMSLNEEKYADVTLIPSPHTCNSTKYGRAQMAIAFIPTGSKPKLPALTQFTDRRIQGTLNLYVHNAQLPHISRCSPVKASHSTAKSCQNPSSR
jgi:hypothetical protein